MSIQLVFPFTDPGNYTYGSNVEVSGGVAKLKLVDLPNQNFNQSFDNDTGFTYDSDKAEFTGGLVRQKDQVPANAMFGASYTTNINGVWGDGTLTGAAVGGATITGNRLDLTGESIKYVDYDADLNADSQQVGCIRFKLTPNYSGAPASIKNFISISKQAGFNDNGIKIFQSSTVIFIQIADSAAGSIVSNAESWSPVSGTTYEIELNWDITTGATRLFIDGVQLGSTQTGTGTRDANINLFRVGADVSATLKSDFYIEDLIVFDTVQHTSNYTPGYTLSEYMYLASNVICPEMEYTGVGTLQAVSNFVTTDTNTPHYTIQIGRSGDYLYWDGADWTTSDGTYAQANDEATFLANVGSLDIEGEIYGQFKINFDNSNSNQMSVADLTVTVTGQTYPTDNPTIDGSASYRIQGLDRFEETAPTKPGSDEIKYTLKKGTSWYYWNGAAWVVSDETYAQANTAAEIEANKATFTTLTITFAWRAFLHSDDGTTTPELDQLEIDYDYAGVTPDSVEKCVVSGHIYDADGNPKVNALIKAILETDNIKYKTNIMLECEEQSDLTDVNGYWELELVETDNIQDTPKYIFTFENKIYRRNVPDQASADFYTLT